MSGYALRGASLTRPAAPSLPARNLDRPDGAAKERRHVVGKAIARGFGLAAAGIAWRTVALLWGTLLALGTILPRRPILLRTRGLRTWRTIAVALGTLGTTGLARRALALTLGLDHGLVAHAGDGLGRLGLAPRTIPPALALGPLGTNRRRYFSATNLG